MQGTRPAPGVEVRGKLGGTRRDRTGPRPCDSPPVQGPKARGERRFGYQANTALRGGEEGKEGVEGRRSTRGSGRRMGSGSVREEGEAKEEEWKAKRFERQLTRRRLCKRTRPDSAVGCSGRGFTRATGRGGRERDTQRRSEGRKEGRIGGSMRPGGRYGYRVGEERGLSQPGQQGPRLVRTPGE